MSVCIISNGNMIHNGKLKRSWKLDLEILVNDTDIKIAQDEDDSHVICDTYVHIDD